jgi:hypothetical protein
VGNTGLMNEHGLSESGEHESETDDGNYPPGKTAHPRHRSGVLNEEKPKTQTG